MVEPATYGKNFVPQWEVVKEMRAKFKNPEIQRCRRTTIWANQGFARADTLLTFLKSEGYKLKGNNDMPYCFADCPFGGHFVLVLKGDLVVKTRWVRIRKQIGSLFHQYRNYDFLVYYPQSTGYRFYKNLEYPGLEWGTLQRGKRGYLNPKPKDPNAYGHTKKAKKDKSPPVVPSIMGNTDIPM